MALPVLFPVPRTIEAFDATSRVVGEPNVVVDHALPAQGYELVVNTTGVHLNVADDAGRRDGEATLAQLRRADGTLPGVHIVDSPDFATRGYMLDISRDRVPTRATLEALVERLATCRYNQLQLYVEHTFAYAEHRKVWAAASPMTADDLTWLDGICAARGIELVTNQNTFGHFERWLAYDTYRPRAECPNGFEVVPGISLPPTVLAPTPDNAEFALALVREQMSCVASRTVNIGCDETFELGRGVSATAVADRGLGSVYAEHLRRIVDPLVASGAHVQYWGDVARHHPDVLDTLPDQGCTSLVWNYDAPDVTRPDIPAEIVEILAGVGVDPAAPTDFATILEPFVASVRDFWVAPGTSTWQSFIGRLDNAKANLLDAARAGRAAGATGYLVTDWGDRGHHQPPAVSLAPLAYGGAVAWCADTNHDLDLAATIDRHLVDDQTGIFGGVVERIGAAATDTGITVANASPLFISVVPSVIDFTSGNPDPDALDAITDSLEAARHDLAASRPGCADAEDLSAALDVAIGLAEHGACRLAARGRGEKLDSGEAVAELDDLIDRYRTTWLASARPGGLDDSAAHLERCRDSYRATPSGIE